MTPMTPSTCITTITTITTRLAWLAAKLHRWTGVAVAALAATVIVHLDRASDPLGILAVAAIVGTAMALYLATTCRDAADTLRTLAAAAVAGVAALEEIERSLGEIEHAAGLAEESLDLLSTAATAELDRRVALLEHAAAATQRTRNRSLRDPVEASEAAREAGRPCTSTSTTRRR